jgi:[ribosomal protein S18]-alanine N-acetyltransferase
MSEKGEMNPIAQGALKINEAPSYTSVQSGGSLMQSDLLENSNFSVVLKPLPEDLLLAAVDLDRLVFGGFWNATAYQQELERANSDLLGIWPVNFSGSNCSFLLALGCSWSILDEVHIILLAVHPDYRQRSLGLAMVLGLLDLAVRRGANDATLEVKASNQAAIALYQKLGFTIAGRRPHYYEDTGEDALIMWRSRLQSSVFKTQIALNWQSIEQQQPWQWDRG